MSACNHEQIFHDLMGELDGPPHRALQAHLQECPRCRDEKNRWTNLVTEARQTGETPSARAPLVEKIVARLEAENPKRRRFSIPLAAAGLAAALAFLWLFPKQDSPSTQHADHDPIAGLRDIQEENGSWAGQVGSTAVATLAFLESGSTEKSGPDHSRIADALQFLTRERRAEPLEELLRCLTLLTDREVSGEKAAPQLQLAVDFAFRRAEKTEDAESATLLRRIVEKARKLGLRTEEGERLLGRLALSLGEQVLQKPDWDTLTRRLSSDPASSPLTQASVHLASLVLIQKSL